MSALSHITIDFCHKISWFASFVQMKYKLSVMDAANNFLMNKLRKLADIVIARIVIQLKPAFATVVKNRQLTWKMAFVKHVGRIKHILISFLVPTSLSKKHFVFAAINVQCENLEQNV